jgi:hypothetical protein
MWHILHSAPLSPGMWICIHGFIPGPCVHILLSLAALTLSTISFPSQQRLLVTCEGCAWAWIDGETMLMWAATTTTCGLCNWTGASTRARASDDWCSVQFHGLDLASDGGAARTSTSTTSVIGHPRSGGAPEPPAAAASEPLSACHGQIMSAPAHTCIKAWLCNRLA